TGNHPSLSQPYSPMTIRFFILQAHYGSTLDFSNEALQAAEKGLKKLMSGTRTLERLFQTLPENEKILPVTLDEMPAPSQVIRQLYDDCKAAMDDNLNSPVVIAHLFDAVRIINSAHDGKEKLSNADILWLKRISKDFITDILGLKDEFSGESQQVVDGLMKLVLDLRQEARQKKDFSTSDQIRDALQQLKISVKDTREGSTWEMEE
ncbi:MAG: cysteine--tRNA ligase, partial [Bacteroidota bacterium]|nr:cysteine--tRNA ligase [Bacteroidota bacterium]